MSTLRVSNIEAKADPSSPSVDEKLKFTNSNGDVLLHLDGKTSGITTVGINTTSATFSVDNNQNVEFLGIVTATKFSLSGGGEITGGDGNFTGIVTAGSLSVTGNVSIGGTLTYEDVTSIDSIGIITARDDVHVGAGLSVVGISTLANTNINGQLTATNARITGVTTFGTSSITINGAHEYPSIRPTLDLNFAATKTLDRRITFTRDGVGTYVDELGIVRTVSSNVPRFDHDPTTGESLGLLIEESRTNLFVESEAFNTGWANVRSSDSGTTATADPEGNTTGAAYKLVANTDNNTHRLDRGSLSMSVSTTYTMSVWAKAAEYTGVSLTIADSSNASNGIYFDLSNGTFTNGGNAHSGSMIAYPNGWYRCIATYTTPASISFQQCLIGVLEDGTTKSYTGDNSSGIYIWGAQLEEGSFPTSYIPTSGSTVTRAQDTAKITGTNFTDFYNDTEGTIVDSCTFISEVTSSFSGGNPRVYTFSDGSENNNLNKVRTSSITSDRIIVRSGGTAQADLQAAYTSTLSSLVSTSYKVDDFRLQSSNGSVATDNSGAVPSGVTQLTFGTYDVGGFTATRVLNGTIKRFTYYPKRLPNAQLQGLTAQ